MKQIIELDYIRALCALGIVFFHYFYWTPYKDWILIYDFPNGDWGEMFVAVFFILSGFLFAYKYLAQEKINIKNYYIKRLKALFPSFYIAYFSVYLLLVAETNFNTINLFPNCELWTIFLTLIGCDGYLLWKFPNFYILGEWFLGAIILLYLLAPIIFYSLKQHFKTTLFLILIFYCYEINLGHFYSDDYRSISSCILSFISGILIYKYNVLKYIQALYISVILSIIIFCLPLDISSNICVHINGVAFFINLYWGAKFLITNNLFVDEMKYLSKISFQIFLLQHIVIIRMISFCTPTTIWQSVALLLSIVFMTVFLANILYHLANAVNRLTASIFAPYK